MKFVFIIFGILIAFISIIIIRAILFKAPKNETATPPEIQYDDEAIERFRKILHQKTVWSRDTAKINFSAFDSFLNVLKETYPIVFSKATVNTVNKYGIIIKLAGTDSTLDPLILMGHYDVVDADESEWSHPPFAAEISDGVIYARGSVDTKCITCAVLEAMSRMIKDGFNSKRDIYLLSTNNEEIGGDTTPEMVKWFKNQNIKPYLVLDEGGAVTDALPFGVTTPFAMIGVTEKGVADLKISIKCHGGHSSAPSKNDASVQLVKALNNIIENPHKAVISPAVKAMMISLAKRSTFLYRMIFANLWIFSPLVKKIMTGSAMTNAMISTTDALTMISGSEQINVLPSEATAGFSVRIAPGESVDIAVNHIKKVCNNSNLDFEIMYSFEPSPVSSFNCEQYSLIADTVKSIYTKADVSPYLMNGGTDSKHFAFDCNYVYRFAGFEFSGAERKSIHGIDEGLRVDSYLKGIEFYQKLMQEV